MSNKDDNVSEFPGRKPTEFDSQTAIHRFNQELANLINANSGQLSIINIVGSLEVMKADILSSARMTAPTGEKH